MLVALENLPVKDKESLFKQLWQSLFLPLDINHQTMATLYQLPMVEKHKDPFDRIMIWQCIQDDFTLLSQDGKFNEYQPFGLTLI